MDCTTGLHHDPLFLSRSLSLFLLRRLSSCVAATSHTTLELGAETAEEEVVISQGMFNLRADFAPLLKVRYPYNYMFTPKDVAGRTPRAF